MTGLLLIAVIFLLVNFGKITALLLDAVPGLQPFFQ
jgi:hypothetical protein